MQSHGLPGPPPSESARNGGRHAALGHAVFQGDMDGMALGSCLSLRVSEPQHLLQTSRPASHTGLPCQAAHRVFTYPGRVGNCEPKHRHVFHKHRSFTFCV